MNLADVMEEVAQNIVGAGGLRVFAYPADKVTPPAAIVSYPTTYTYDETYGRGSDRMELPLWVVVSKVTDRTTRDRIGQYVNGSGSASIKEAVESGDYTSCDTARVMRVDFDSISLAGVEYLAATFTIEITGSGA